MSIQHELSKCKQENRLKFTGSGSKPEPPAAVNGYLLTTSMWNLPLFPVFRDGMWNFFQSFFFRALRTFAADKLDCWWRKWAGELQAQTAGYLSACELVEGIRRALPELLTHLTRCTLGERGYACSRVIQHGCAPPVRLECDLISLALAELGAAAVSKQCCFVWRI